MFRPDHWFTRDDERIEHGGVTYAVSNQWGERAIEWLDEVLRAFPGHGVAIEASE